MDFFINYGGLIILGIVFYIAIYWLLPLVEVKTTKTYLYLVLLFHIVTLVFAWAFSGINKVIETNQEQRRIGIESEIQDLTDK